jgi:hypothetical protein
MRTFHRPGFWSGRESTEKRKRECLTRRLQVIALPAYRTLRNKFVRIFKQRCIPEFPARVGQKVKNSAKNPPKRIFFNNVFSGLRESHVHDQFGHLSDSGVRVIIDRLEKIFLLSE